MGSNMSTYFITGSTGYIGSMLSKHLLENEPDNKIVASVRDIQKAKHWFRRIYVTAIFQDIFARRQTISITSCTARPLLIPGR